MRGFPYRFYQASYEAGYCSDTDHLVPVNLDRERFARYRSPIDSETVLSKGLVR